MEKRAFEQPEIGIFYLVPNPKTKIYTILSAFDRPGEDSAHYFLWDEVVKTLRFRFKKANVDGIQDSYQGLPRGRISIKGTNYWVVLHGDDFPLQEYKSDIVSEFKLMDAESINKVSWAVETHEKMNPNEKKRVEEVLGISISPSGFKMKKGA